MLTMEGLLAVLSFELACFSVGYAIGRNDNHKTRKQPPGSAKLSSCFFIVFCLFYNFAKISDLLIYSLLLIFNGEGTMKEMEAEQLRK